MSYDYLWSRHFGEAPAQCGCMCDICISGPASLLNVTTAARTVCRTLSDLPTAEKRATLIQLLDKARLSKVLRTRPLPTVLAVHITHILVGGLWQSPCCTC